MAEQQGQRASNRASTAPDPEDPRKPDSPTEITKRSWTYVAKKTFREFMADQCTDLAAALTYFGTLAVFPALLAFVSILGVVGDAERTTSALIDTFSGLVPADTLDAVREPIRNLASSPAAGLGLVTGILGALWSASGYVGAFSRAMNRIYNIQEGRPVWKLRPVTLLVTVVAVLAAVLAAAIVVLSGPIAEQVGDAIGLGPVAVTVWNIAKWPILLIIAVSVLALLYYATPNLKQPKFTWVSIGSIVALVVWALASAGFAFYAANFSSYNATYGSIGGVIVFLLWIWISNNALLFGAELDAELERGRQLQAGIPAEEDIQLPPRDTKVSDKKAEKHEDDVKQARELREQSGGELDAEEWKRQQYGSDDDDSKAEEEAEGEKSLKRQIHLSRVREASARKLMKKVRKSQR